MTVSTSAQSTTPRPRRLAPVVLLLATLAVSMAQTIVVAALPRFAAGLGTDASAATWLLTAFMLASAVVTPIAGRMGDLYGHRRILIAGLAVLLVGSVVAGISDLAGSYPGLLAGRVVQGCSGGVFPVAFGLIRYSAAPLRQRGLISGLSAMFGVGGALGMVVAGPIVDLAGTSALFWTIGAIVVLALLGTPALFADRPAKAADSTESEPARLDIGGAALLALTLVSLLLGISQGSGWGWASIATIGCFVLAVIAAIAFVITEQRVGHPLVNLRLLRHPTLAGTNVATVIISIGMFAAVTLIPQLVQTPADAGYGFGYSATQTGLLLIPTAVLMVIAAPLATRLSTRFGRRLTFQIGAAFACVSLAMIGLLHQNPWELYLGGAVLGLAYGLAFASLGGLVMSSVEHRDAGAATGLNTILRTIGGAVGAQLAAVTLIAFPNSGQRPPEAAYTTAFLISAGVALAALAIAATVRHPHAD